MNTTLRTALLFVLYALAQVVLFKHMQLGELARAHVHLLFLLLLPSDWRPLPLLLIAFALGLGVSLFDRPVGAHAAACLNLVVFRAWWIGMVTPGLAASREALDFERQDIPWYVSYLLPPIFVYELSFFIWANLEFDFLTLSKALVSTLYSGALCLALVILFTRRR